MLQLGQDERREPPRRLRELRLKEAIRKGDLSPEEARDWRRNKHQQQEAGRQDEDRREPRNRSHWRDTQRRALDDDR